MSTLLHSQVHYSSIEIRGNVALTTLIHKATKRKILLHSQVLRRILNKLQTFKHGKTKNSGIGVKYIFSVQIKNLL